MIEDAIRSLLIAPGSATAALVGDRVYPLELPQKGGNELSDLPAVVYRVIDAPRTYHHKGPSHLITARIQLDLIGETYSQAQKMVRAVAGSRGVAGDLSGRQVEVAFDGEPHTVAIRRIFVRMERDSGESDLNAAGAIPRQKSLDLEVWFWEN